MADAGPRTGSTGCTTASTWPAATLDAQLLRRSGATLELASSEVLDPPSRLVLLDAATQARNAGPEEFESAESELSQALRAVFADAGRGAALRDDPAVAPLVDELARDCARVELARRFHNDVGGLRAGAALASPGALAAPGGTRRRACAPSTWTTYPRPRAARGLIRLGRRPARPGRRLVASTTLRVGRPRPPGNAEGLTVTNPSTENGTTGTGTAGVKRGMAEMLKGGVIMDVVTAEQAKIAEDAGAVAVMALERVPADIRAQGGVSRMSDPDMIEGIIEAVSIPVMAKARIGHFVEAQVLQSLGVDYIDESEVLTPADYANHIDKLGVHGAVRVRRDQPGRGAAPDHRGRGDDPLQGRGRHR